MEIKQALEKMVRHAIHLDISGQAEMRIGETRFGGSPDVPVNFAWPTFETAGMDDEEIKPRPLSFLAQFNCDEMAEFDKEELLPKSGLLSFFYEVDSQRWGFDPKDGGCARVFWFEEVSSLVAAEFPQELEKDYRFPEIKMSASAEASLPQWVDFSTGRELSDDDYSKFEVERAMMGGEEPEISSKLLGWPDVIQNNMTCECELISRGYYLGNLWEQIPKEVIAEAEATSIENWRLLFQLDIVSQDDFELMFGDCGRLYFYIRKEDLLQRRFDRVWLILQCC